MSLYDDTLATAKEELEVLLKDARNNIILFESCIIPLLSSDCDTKGKDYHAAKNKLNEAEEYLANIMIWVNGAEKMIKEHSR